MDRWMDGWMNGWICRTTEQWADDYLVWWIDDCLKLFID